MDQGDNDIRQSMKDTRQDMEETRAAMTEKIDLLEERVRETVENAASTVDNIVDNVRDTVDETVGAVRQTVGGARSTAEEIVEEVKDTVDDAVAKLKQSLDFHYQMEQHPWMMLSASVLIGYWLGSREANHTRAAYPQRHSLPEGMTRQSQEDKPSARVEPVKPSAANVKTRTSRLWNTTLSQFDEEIDIVKKAIMGALLSNLGTMAKQSLPSIAPQLDKAVDSAMAKLGGQPQRRTRQREEGAEPSNQADPESGAGASHSSSAATRGQKDQVTL